MEPEYIMARKEGSILNTVKVLTILNLMLAVMALLKDILMAAYLGTSGEADALLLAYSMNDIPGNNLLASAIGTSCIPVFSALYLKGGKKEFKQTIAGISTIVLAVSASLLILLYIFKDVLIGLMGRGFAGDIYFMCISLFVIMLPTILLYPSSAIGTSVLQVSGRFTLPAAAPVVFNTVFFISLAVGSIFNIPVSSGVYAAASSITIGVISMVLMVWVPLYRYKIKAFSISAFRNAIKPGTALNSVLKSIMKIFAPYLFILLATQAVLYVERYIVSGMGEGYISGLNYAYRLSQFPVWVFVSAVGTVVYPSMSKHVAEEDYGKLNGVISKAICTVLIITVPMSLLLMVFRVPVISVLFLRGAFDLNSLKITSDILFGYCLAIAGQSAAAISLKALLSAGEMRLAFASYAISFIVNVLLDFLLTPVIGAKGIGYGAAAAAVLNGILTYLAVKKRFGVSLNFLNVMKVLFKRGGV